MLLFIRRKRKVILYNYIACNEGSLIGPTEVERRRGLMFIEARTRDSSHSQSASPIQHTVNLVFGYKVFLKVYFNVKIHAGFKSVCSQTQNVERFAKSMF